MDLRQFLLILHFIGLAMGLGAGFANMAIGLVAAKSTPADQAVLARLPPALMRIGDTGLILLWASGLTMFFQYYGGFDGFSVLGWPFHVKITLAILLTGLIGYIHTLARQARAGDKAAAARIPKVGRVTLLTAITIVVMAVLAFN